MNRGFYLAAVALAGVLGWTCGLALYRASFPQKWEDKQEQMTAELAATFPEAFPANLKEVASKCLGREFTKLAATNNCKFDASKSPLDQFETCSTDQGLEDMIHLVVMTCVAEVKLTLDPTPPATNTETGPLPTTEH